MEDEQSSTHAYNQSRPQRKLKMEMSLYSRSTTVIHHDIPWLIRHDTLSVRVRQSSGNRSGSGINGMHVNALCSRSWMSVSEMIWICRDNFKNNVSNACIMTVFKTIWNCREHFINNFFKACALKVFEKICNCREKMKTMPLKHAFWWYMKRFGTAEK